MAALTLTQAKGLLDATKGRLWLQIALSREPGMTVQITNRVLTVLNIKPEDLEQNGFSVMRRTNSVEVGGARILELYDQLFAATLKPRPPEETVTVHGKDFVIPDAFKEVLGSFRTKRGATDMQGDVLALAREATTLGAVAAFCKDLLETKQQFKANNDAELPFEDKQALEKAQVAYNAAMDMVVLADWMEGHYVRGKASKPSNAARLEKLRTALGDIPDTLAWAQKAMGLVWEILRDNPTLNQTMEAQKVLGYYDVPRVVVDGFQVPAPYFNVAVWPDVAAYKADLSAAKVAFDERDISHRSEIKKLADALAATPDALPRDGKKR